ncbi:tripartite tricarboxylate transporter TctB family protein [Chelatococcus asaccharovorans]|uniref:Tripartite tricarboxylate transporter TctB family protein n=1 Tax=Chelatococcus asaccharovorans TaxID=28210 RepID=A0A2V3U8R3_9HYPH|nr:tripartite tricarboxylate transporter TctB family protein [Chelatococcus asaccharovorans]MBS7705516.1 tripartite tricarboxylate transporter TctB family protein [Chelatococcus asaccharovorans]PXW60079.1 tripartite tricarboxylate transporter TctB family protein [Chelatococcus asaccharovorans]CAH1656068.1 Tripartite tricarboxylate transporter TctB family protein [Chelatococcus asaccharovorans]CAH1685231.1 Tripartite tricarboxylate transporter TctB family protein [Chelatococcus asaccharovorans]
MFATYWPSRRNMVFGIVFVSFSALMAFETLRKLPIGTPANMGPGFFPLLLSISLGAISILAVVFGQSSAQEEPLKVAPFRAVALVLGAPIVFSLSIDPLGLFFAVFLSVLFSTQASIRSKIGESILLSAGFSAFCVLVFIYLLNLPLPLWGWLIAG